MTNRRTFMSYIVVELGYLLLPKFKKQQPEIIDRSKRDYIQEAMTEGDWNKSVSEGKGTRVGDAHLILDGNFKVDMDSIFWNKLYPDPTPTRKLFWKEYMGKEYSHPVHGMIRPTYHVTTDTIHFHRHDNGKEV